MHEGSDFKLKVRSLRALKAVFPTEEPKVIDGIIQGGPPTSYKWS